MTPDRAEITDLLAALRAGQPDAMERLLPLVYDELRRRARRERARAGRSPTLSTTGLVHEAYLKLVGSRGSWEDRNHFFAVAVKAMRGVLVDYARKRLAKKRGGAAARPIDLDPDALHAEHDAEEILAVHEAMDRLAGIDPRLHQIVELRFFGGLSIEESAEVLGLSDRTIKREWTKARTLLHGMLGQIP